MQDRRAGADRSASSMRARIGEFLRQRDFIPARAAARPISTVKRPSSARQQAIAPAGVVELQRGAAGLLR